MDTDNLLLVASLVGLVAIAFCVYYFVCQTLAWIFIFLAGLGHEVYLVIRELFKNR
jgi:hypothetical protein